MIEQSRKKYVYHRLQEMWCGKDIYTEDKFKHIATPDNQKILWVHMVQIFNRPCEAGAVLQSPPSLIDLF